MPEWTGKTRGGLFGHKFFVFLIDTFGIKSAYLFLRLVAFYFLIFSSKKHIFHFYHTMLKHGYFNSILKIYSNYCNLGEVLIDKFCLLSGIKTNFTYDFDGENFLRELKQGGILISAHLGSWEIAGQLLERLEIKFNIVMYDAEHERIKDYVDELMTKKNFRVIIMKDDLSHIYEIKEALDNRELVCLHSDRFVEGSKQILCDFMGGKAYFPAGPFYLVSKFDVPVSFVFAFKETSNHYHFFATESKKYDFSNIIKERDNNIRLVLNDYIAELEKKVRLFPGQWFNYHKFWE